MQNIIEDIFHYNVAISANIDRAVYYFRTQNFEPALQLVTQMVEQMNSWLGKVIERAEYFNENNIAVDVDYIVSILESLFQAQINKDYILLADIYEAQLLPILCDIQGIIMDREGVIFSNQRYQKKVAILKNTNVNLKKYYTSIEELLEHVEAGYFIEYTSRGQYTLAVMDGDKKVYLHSNFSVSREALQLANNWYLGEKHTYIIYGFGFGYHIYELLNLDRNICIEIYESDHNVIQLACAFSPIGPMLENPNVTLNYDPDFSKLSQRIKNISSEDEFVIHYPSMRTLKASRTKEQLENYFLQYSSIKNQLKLLNGNFRKNITRYDGLADELAPQFKGKDIYIVAAGPSLDHNFLQLKKVMNKSDSIILATGTVLKKLLSVGIRPNYFIVTDANEKIYEQIKGLEYENIPMLYLSTAHHGFATNYKGNKYIVLQQDFDKSEQYAEEKGAKLYKTGGSVSTTALDIGITLGCRRIIFLGLDLAYTNNYVHATETSRRELDNTDDLRQVKDIHGKLVYTNTSLSIYKKWIEDRIADVKEIEFIDATEGGAKVRGMKVKTLNQMVLNPY